MIENIDKYIQQIVDLLGKLYGLPSYAVVFIACIAVGYVLRLWKSFPNEAIPIVAIVWGAAFLPLVADPWEDGSPWRIWFFKNFLIGLIIGAAAWVFHNQILSKFEAKIPFLGPKLVEPPTTPPPTP